MDLRTRMNVGHTVLFLCMIMMSSLWIVLFKFSSQGYTKGSNGLNPWPSGSGRDLLRISIFAAGCTIVGPAGLILVRNVAWFSVTTRAVWHFIFSLWSSTFWVSTAGSVTSLLGGMGCQLLPPNRRVYCRQLSILQGFGWAIWALITLDFIIFLFYDMLTALRLVGGAHNTDGDAVPSVAQVPQQGVPLTMGALHAIDGSNGRSDVPSHPGLVGGRHPDVDVDYTPHRFSHLVSPVGAHTVASSITPPTYVTNEF
ncbi:hypothetical protein HGRIS_000610 [Hohenbuehelia grisea]|uniref:Uncharacterized protein n=1 Tax=Hohenbuehelia grisea TaxID=104357 RepID=A0ABR3JRQ7_9AGAR